MAYRLKFMPEALSEWQTLDGSIKENLRKLLKKRLSQPHVPGAELHGDLRGCYKIKLLKQGYRRFTRWRTTRLSSWLSPSTSARTWRPIAPH